MSQKQKAAAMAAQANPNPTLQQARKPEGELNFLLQGIGGGVGGPAPRGADAPGAASPAEDILASLGQTIGSKLSGTAPGRVIGGINAIRGGDIKGLAGAVAPQTMGKVDQIASLYKELAGLGGAGAGTAAGAAGAGTAAAGGAGVAGGTAAAGTAGTAAAGGSAAGGGGILGTILKFFI